MHFAPEGEARLSVERGGTRRGWTGCQRIIGDVESDVAHGYALSACSIRPSMVLIGQPDLLMFLYGYRSHP